MDNKNTPILKKNNNQLNNIHRIENSLIKLILHAIQSGDINLIKLNIEKYQIDLKHVKTENEQNAFFYIAFIQKDEDSLKVCKYLKELGVNPNYKDKLNQTCIYYTVRENKYLTTKYLIDECNLSINEKDIFGQTPIYYCCREGHLKICELLYEKGGNINHVDNYEENCLFYAIRQGHYDVVKFLIEKGININKLDNGKLTPALYAKKINQIKILNLLLQHGALFPENIHIKKEYTNEDEENSDSKNNQFLEKKKLKQNYINEIQKPKNFYIVALNENGKKIKLNNEELILFYKNNPEIENLLTNKKDLNKKINCVDENLKLYKNWEKTAKRLFVLLCKIKEAEIFIKPIKIKEHNDYFEKIKNPIDFFKIKEKLINYNYRNFKEFYNDITLVFDNYCLYNGKESEIGKICIKIKNEFIKLCQHFNVYKFM